MLSLIHRPKRYLAAEHARAPGTLADKLTQLREMAKERPPHPRLWKRAKHFCPGTRSERRDWCARVWWGIAAGELLRVHLYDRASRAQAMDLVLPPDLSALDPARTGRGAILAAAHLGPPKFAMNLVLDRFAKPLIVTNTQDMPDWQRAEEGGFLNPRDTQARAQILLRGAVQLRRGGVFFAAPDGKQTRDTLGVEGFGQHWEFSVGLPALARKLKADSFVFLALWEGERIALRCTPITVPAELAPEDHHRAWIEAYWRSLSSVIASSPENLRFLAPPLRKEFTR